MMTPKAVEMTTRATHPTMQAINQVGSVDDVTVPDSTDSMFKLED